MAKTKQVRAIRSFVDGKHGLVVEGQTVPLPAGVDWLEVGLVEVVDGKDKPRKRGGRAGNKRGGKGVGEGG